MIQLLEAPPRSGKTFFAVNYAVKFTKYDGLYHEYILDPSVLIISNIEGLKINHWQLDATLRSRLSDSDKKDVPEGCLFKNWNLDGRKKTDVLEKFFNIENFEKIMEKTNKNRVIILIDEVHDYFPTGYYNQKIYSFFAYHGHIGLDIILMTQSLDATTRMFNPLLESIIKVTPRSKAVLNRFSYTFCDKSGRFLYSQTLAKDQLVFKAYKSFRVDEHNKPKNAVKHWIIITVAIFSVGGFLFKTALSLIRAKSERHTVKSAVVDKQPPFVKDGKVVQTVYNPPVQHKVSSARVVPSPVASVPVVTSKSVSVVGLAYDGNKHYYLLSDGRTVKSNRLFKRDDLFIEN